MQGELAQQEVMESCQVRVLLADCTSDRALWTNRSELLRN